MKKSVGKTHNQWWYFGLGAIGLLALAYAVFSWLGIQCLCEEQAYLGRSFDENRYRNPFWYSKANFDGFHYLSIAQGGYGYAQEAFFPLYPRLINLLTKVTQDYLASGLVISMASLIGAVFVFGRLMAAEGEEEEVIRNTLLGFLLFPTAFYFLSVYTESLFLFLALLSFYLAKRKRWLEAGLVGGVAAYTRVAGILILPALLVEYWSQRSYEGRVEFRRSLTSSIRRPGVFWRYVKEVERKFYHLKNTLYILLSSWGLVAYGLALKRRMGDFFYFVRVQPPFGAQGPADKLILPYQVVWRYLKMLILVEKNILRYYTIWLEFLVAGLIGLLLVLGLTKRFKVPKSYLLFGGLAYILPILTGTFLSMPRFALVIFPAFWVLGKVVTRYRKLGLAYFIFSVSWLMAMIILFVRGYWVA